MTKYSDAPTVEVEVVIDAPAAEVWTLVTDINTSSRFSSEQRGCRWLDGAGQAAVGARFAGTNFHPAAAREWESVSTVTELEPQRLFGWTVGDVNNPSARWRFELSPDGGRTRLRQWAQIGPGPSGLTPAIEANPDREERIVQRRLDEHRANMTATVEGIKSLAEQSS